MPLQTLLGKKIYRALVAEVGGGEHQRPGGPKRKGIKAKGTPSRGVHPGGTPAEGTQSGKEPPGLFRFVILFFKIAFL